MEEGTIVHVITRLIGSASRLCARVRIRRAGARRVVHALRRVTLTGADSATPGTATARSNHGAAGG